MQEGAEEHSPNDDPKHEPKKLKRWQVLVGIGVVTVCAAGLLAPRWCVISLLLSLGRWFERHSDAMAALGTIVTAALTIILAIVARRQIVLVGHQVEAANNQANAAREANQVAKDNSAEALNASKESAALANKAASDAVEQARRANEITGDTLRLARLEMQVAHRPRPRVVSADVVARREGDAKGADATIRFHSAGGAAATSLFVRGRLDIVWVVFGTAKLHSLAPRLIGGVREEPLHLEAESSPITLTLATDDIAMRPRQDVGLIVSFYYREEFEPDRWIRLNCQALGRVGDNWTLTLSDFVVSSREPDVILPDDAPEWARTGAGKTQGE